MAGFADGEVAELGDRLRARADVQFFVDAADVGVHRAPADQQRPDITFMWNQPYLETCCRSALHRLTLGGAAGRPPGLKDGRCLERLSARGWSARPDGRYELTEAGIARHASEVLHIAFTAR